MRIQHVQLAIPLGTLADARGFYLGVLGLKEISRPTGLTNRPGIWLRLEGGQEIHLAEDSISPNAATKSHVALELQDLRLLEDRLEGAGVKIEKTSEGGGFKRLHFRDPFGNRIEILQVMNVIRDQEDLEISFPVGDLERLLAEIESEVTRLLNLGHDKLMNWLYRLDVGEAQVQGIFKHVVAERWAQRIAELIFQRELQKYFHRRKELE